LPKPIINFSNPGVQKVLKLMIPALFGVSVAQLSLLLDTIFASFLKTGSVAWLYYSERLMNFPLGVFGVAIATVILPKLSRASAKIEHRDYSATLDWAIRLLLLIGLPASISLFLLAGPLLSTLFQGGRFNGYSVLMARQSLLAFAIGVQAFMLIKVFASAFYAKQDIRTPVKIAIMALIFNMICNVVFIFPLAHAGLALATSIAAFLNAGLLLIVLLKRKIYLPQLGWLKFMGQLGISNISITCFLWFSTGSVQTWIMLPNRWIRSIHLSILLIGAGIIYGSVLYLCGMRVRDFYLED
jgi:putative peptidoglycan lipid II flippase